MKNIHLLPTDKASRLHYFTANKAGYYLYPNKLVVPRNPNCINQKIQITSDEEIKEGDWFISSGLVWKVNRNVNLINPEKDKKIILTTDQDLIADGVQAIGDDFLEWFVKNPSCEGVEIYREKPIGYTDNIHITFWGLYKIITPKECMITKIMQMDAKMAYDSLPKQEILLEDVFNEEKKKGVKELIDKQETLEEETIEEYYLSSIKNVLQFNNDAQAIRLMEKYFEQKCFIERRSYSEEEVKTMFSRYNEFISHHDIEEWQNWIDKQFKKK